MSFWTDIINLSQETKNPNLQSTAQILMLFSISEDATVKR